MDAEFTDEQLMFRNMAGEFAKREIIPTVAQDDVQERYRADIIESMANIGLLGGPIPQDYGGLGMDHICYSLICEEIGGASAAVFTTALLTHVSLFQIPILKWGNEEQKQWYLPRAARGELLGSFTFIEPEADLNALQIRALPEGNTHWLLNGERPWVSNGGVADNIIALAQTDPAKGFDGISAFIVERGAPGISTHDEHDKMGLRACNMARLSFQNYRVPPENNLGGLGNGFRIAMFASNHACLAIAAASVGIAQACLDAAVSYAQQREQFGKTIGNFHLIQEIVADMTIETEAARLVVYRLGHLIDKGNPIDGEAPIARLYATEVAVRAASKAIQLHGSYGLTVDFPLERRYRDAMALRLYQGIPQAQKLAIARNVLKMNAVN